MTDGSPGPATLVLERLPLLSRLVRRVHRSRTGNGYLPSSGLDPRTWQGREWFEDRARRCPQSCLPAVSHGREPQDLSRLAGQFVNRSLPVHQSSISEYTAATSERTCRGVRSPAVESLEFAKPRSNEGTSSQEAITRLGVEPSRRLADRIGRGENRPGFGDVPVRANAAAGCQENLPISAVGK